MIQKKAVSADKNNYLIKSLFKQISSVLLITFLYVPVHAQNITVDDLLKRIDSLQQTDDAYFIDGIFSSYISNKQKFNQRKPDNTIFYNALIVHTLKRYNTQLTSQQKLIVDRIVARSQHALPKFKNDERNTYNFWRTDSSFKFPYTWWIPLLRGDVTLPDDMDDTVFGLDIANANDSIAEAIHQLMQEYINTSNHLETTYPTYQSYKAYSTWFGKKVPVVFDVCVLTNILAFVQQHNLKWTSADSTSLDLIIDCINNNDYINHPLILSPYYGTTSIILYHLARLMSVKPIPQLKNLKLKLITTALQQLTISNNDFEKVLLTTSLMKWNCLLPEEKLPTIKQVEKNDYPFFIGNIPSYFKQPVKGWLMSNDVLLFYHYCPAWNDVLLLENILLRNAAHHLN